MPGNVVRDNDFVQGPVGSGLEHRPLGDHEFTLGQSADGVLEMRCVHCRQIAHRSEIQAKQRYAGETMHRRQHRAVAAKHDHRQVVFRAVGAVVGHDFQPHGSRKHGEPGANRVRVRLAVIDMEGDLPDVGAAFHVYFMRPL